MVWTEVLHRQQRMSIGTQCLVFLLSCLCACSVQLRSQTSDCACLNFAESYNNNVVKCGDGNEKTGSDYPCDWYGVGKPEFHYTGLVGKGKTFLRMNHSMCVEIQKDDGSSWKTKIGSWCYVSASCTALNGGKRVNDKAAWKKCTKGVDHRIGDMKPAA